MGKALDQLDKLDSRLRCVANGETEINAVRAAQNGAVRIKTTLQAAARPRVIVEPGLKTLGRSVRALHRGKQTALDDDVEVNLFVLLDRSDAPTPRFVTRRNGRIAIATATLAQLHSINDHASVQFLELGETLKLPHPKVTAELPEVPAAKRFAALNGGVLKVDATVEKSLDGVGENVLVGIIDVGGLDFSHSDFLDDQGHSRVIAIWDQGGDAFDPPELSVVEGKAVKSKSYGSELQATDIALALKQAKIARLSPHDLAPQSQRTRGSHATHVASIAAGRSGVCKRAKIAGVMIALDNDDLDRRQSFYDTTRIVDALAYLFDLAAREKFDAISVNISLGTNGGPHDASEFLSRWIDTSMAEPGRAVCVAAGNSGQERSQFDGDLGFWSGRVHASGKIDAAGLRYDLEWTVVGNGFEDVSENELEIWYGAEDEFVVELFAPDGERIGPIAPGERIENRMLADRTFVSIYNELSVPKNGDNRISVYLSPYMGQPVVGITAGNWKVRLTGQVVRNGAFDAWIERDDPARTSDPARWRLPSFFGANSFVDRSTLSSLACGPRIIGVANYDEARDLLNITSSQGPTRDGRRKPDISAPGTEIVAACGFDPENAWIAMTGTSMASPFVAGVSALMLSLNSKLTAAQISGIIRRTSRPLPGANYSWRSDAGFGVIDPSACLCEALRLKQPVRDLTKGDRA